MGDWGRDENHVSIFADGLDWVVNFDWVYIRIFVSVAAIKAQ
jgi:hypothetical protein